MNGMVSCEYNMDSGCIELKFVDGTEIAIACPARLCGLDSEWQPGNISESRYSM